MGNFESSLFVRDTTLGPLAHWLTYQTMPYGTIQYHAVLIGPFGPHNIPYHTTVPYHTIP